MQTSRSRLWLRLGDKWVFIPSLVMLGLLTLVSIVAGMPLLGPVVAACVILDAQGREEIG